MTTDSPNLIEQEKLARMWRDVIYDRPISEDGWDATRKYWMRYFANFQKRLSDMGMQISRVAQ